jgi:Dolichyl-phosphate-mannose-protein mannosyltransferase
LPDAARHQPPRLTAWLLIAAAVALLVFGRLPSHTNDFCDPDVAQMAYGADDLLAGGVLYENCVETKPPGTYLIFAAAFALFGRSLTPVYWLATLLHLLTLLLLARVAWRAAGPVAAGMTAWFYAALALTVGAAAGCPNHETWMTLPVAGAFALLLPRRDRVGSARIVAAGALLGVAWLMKQQAAAFGLGAVAWLALEKPFDARRFGRNLALLALGSVTPLAITAVVWWTKGGLEPMLHDLRPGRLSSYVGAPDLGDMLAWAWRRGLRFLAGGWPALLGVGAALVAWRRLGEPTRNLARLLFFLGAAVVAVASGTRFFSHYFIILAAPLALAGGYGVGRLARIEAPRAARIVLVVFLFAATPFAVRHELAQAATFAAGHALDAPAMKRFVARDLDLEHRVNDRAFQRLGRYLAENTTADETIYVWPYHPQIYFWADRRAPTKHYCYFDLAVGLPTSRGPWHTVVGPQIERNRTAVLSTLAARPPRFVVFPAAPEAWNKPFARLHTWVTRWYELDPDAPAGPELQIFRKP